jgi:hypothetical protein
VYGGECNLVINVKSHDALGRDLALHSTVTDRHHLIVASSVAVKLNEIIRSSLVGFHLDSRDLMWSLQAKAIYWAG